MNKDETPVPTFSRLVSEALQQLVSVRHVLVKHAQCKYWCLYLREQCLCWDLVTWTAVSAGTKWVQHEPVTFVCTGSRALNAQGMGCGCSWVTSALVCPRSGAAGGRGQPLPAEGGGATAPAPRPGRSGCGGRTKSIAWAAHLHSVCICPS